MVINLHDRWTQAEIAEAAGYKQSTLQVRIAQRTALGLIAERPRGKRGQPSLYSYEEVKMILFPLPKGRPPALRTDTDPDPDRIAALRHQLRTDGFTIIDT